ncbi:MAG: radical SAM protein [Gammaproteobacteria bacterium]
MPLQSGSDAVLKRMARRCTSADFARLAEQARARIADVNLTTDIIVGFPGETETDWQATLDVVERIDFGHIHVFAYSARAGTAAARMRGPVDRATQQRRTRELHERGRRLRRATLARFLDRTFPVLWESRPERLADGRLRYFGYTPNYLRVAAAAPADARLARSVRAARLTGIADSGDHALAELLG